MTKLLKISIFSLLFLTIWGSIFQSFDVYALDWENLARNTIGSAERKIQETSDVLVRFWDNMTDDTRRKVNEDINSAYDRLDDAEWWLQQGDYNTSLRDASTSLFLGARSKYRIYLNMTKLRIEETNETIQNVPWYLGKPWYAIDVLQNATEIYEEQEIPSYLGGSLYAEDVYQQYEMTQYVVTRIEQIIRKLFSDDDSVYNMAVKAENLAMQYQNEQNKVFSQIFLMVVVSLALSFAVGLILGVFSGPRIRHRVSKWRMKLKKPHVSFEQLSKTEQRYCIIIVETSGVIVTALLTLGALIGAVMQEVKYVYVFIGYMFEYALPFVFSALLGIITLYSGAKSRGFFDLYGITVAVFLSGWMSFSWLFVLARAYESIAPGWYYPIDPRSIIFRFAITLAVSFFIVLLLKKKVRIREPR